MMVGIILGAVAACCSDCKFGEELENGINN